MKAIRVLGIAACTLFGASCSDGVSVLRPTSPDASFNKSASASTRAAASGDFTASVDFTTLILTPRGRNCLLEVDGQLSFTGTLEGVATGTTTALVFASCSDVIANPPGTFSDVFRSELEFAGTVNGAPAEGQMVYMGRAQPGGNINAKILLMGDAHAVLKADALVAVGGSYSGFAIN
jgi:hypothetical protein